MKHKKPTILQQETAEQEHFFSRQEEKEHFFNKPQHVESHTLNEPVHAKSNTLNIQKKCATCAAEEKEQETIQKKEMPAMRAAAPAAPAPPTPPATPGAHSIQQPVAQAAAQQANGQFIVADNIVPNAGQMRRTAFLSHLREEICATVNNAMTGTPFTSANCPYIQTAFARYQNSSPQQLEAMLHRYAPATLFARSAQDLVWAVKQKIYTVALQWVQRRMLPQGTGGQAQNAQQNEPGFGGLFFKENTGGASRTQSPGAVMNSLGKGDPLPGNTRKNMEQAFGSSFSGVEIHTNNHASELSREMNARAFTVGNHIAFAGNEYQPGTLVGDALLAHELAHTLQQRGATGGDAQLKGNEYNAFEEDADASALAAMVKISGRSDDLLKNSVRKSLSGGLSISRCSKSSTLSPITAQNYAGRQLDDAQRTQIQTILHITGTGGTSRVAAEPSVNFVLHDTAASVGAARIAELQQQSHRQMGEAAAGYIPRTGDATITRPDFFDPDRPTATESEKANDILGEAERFSLFRSVWNNTNAGHRRTALNQATEGLSTDEANIERRNATNQLASGSRERIMSTGIWAIRAICSMVTAEGAEVVAGNAASGQTLQSNCNALSGFFATRRRRMSTAVNFEIVQERGSDCFTTNEQVAAFNRRINRQISTTTDAATRRTLTARLIPGDQLQPLPPYTPSQYSNISTLYLNAALQANRFPNVTTHYLVDQGAGDHCDPRCFNLNTLYHNIASTLSHHPNSSYGITPSYGTTAGNNVWWVPAVCGGNSP